MEKNKFEEQIKYLENLLKDKDEIIKKMKQDNEDLQNENQVLLDTTQQLVHEKEFLQKNYIKFRKAVLEYKKQEKKDQNTQQFVQNLELESFLHSLLSVLKYLSSTKLNISQKVIEKQITETQTSLKILQENLKMKKNYDQDIFKVLKIIYNKKIFMDYEDVFLHDLNLDILQKKHFINGLISLFRDDKKQVFEDNQIYKTIRKMDGLSISQKKYLISIMTNYFQNNFETLKDIFCYLSNDDIKNIFKDQIYEEIIQHLKQHQFGFYEDFLRIKEDENQRTLYSIADQIKQQDFSEKASQIKHYIDSQQKQNQIYSYISPQKENSEFLQDLQQYQLPSSKLYKERLMNKIVYDIQINEKNVKINQKNYEFLISQIHDTNKSKEIQDFLQSDYSREYMPESLTQQQQKIMLQFKLYMHLTNDIQIIQSSVVDRQFLESTLQNFLKDNIYDLDTYLTELEEIFYDLQPQTKRVLLQYIENTEPITIQQQEFLQKFIGSVSYQYSFVKILKSISYIWLNYFENQHDKVTNESSLIRFDKITRMCSPYYSKYLMIESQKQRVLQKLQNLQKEDLQLLNHHLQQIFLQKNKLQDLEDIFLYTNNIQFINQDISQLVFYFGNYIIQNEENIQVNREQDLKQSLKKINNLYDQELVKKLIKEYTLLENTSQYLIYETFFYKTKGQHKEENFLLLLKLGKDVYKLALILIDLCSYQWELLNYDDNYSDQTEVFYQNDFEQFLLTIQMQEIDDWFQKSNSIQKLLEKKYLEDFMYYIGNKKKWDYFILLYNNNNMSYQDKKFLYNYFVVLKTNYGNVLNKIQNDLSNKEFLETTLPLISFYLSDYYQRELVIRYLDSMMHQETKFLYTQIKHLILKDFTSSQFQNVLDRIQQNDSNINIRNVMRFLVLNFEQLDTNKIESLKNLIKDEQENDIQQQKQFILQLLDQIIIFDWIIEDQKIMNLHQNFKELSYEDKQNIIDGVFDERKRNHNFFDVLNKLDDSNEFLEKISDQCFKLGLTPFHREQKENFDYQYYNILEDYFVEIQNLIVMRTITKT